MTQMRMCFLNQLWDWTLQFSQSPTLKNWRDLSASRMDVPRRASILDAGKSRLIRTRLCRSPFQSYPYTKHIEHCSSIIVVLFCANNFKLHSLRTPTLIVFCVLDWVGRTWRGREMSSSSLNPGFCPSGANVETELQKFGFQRTTPPPQNLPHVCWKPRVKTKDLWHQPSPSVATVRNQFNWIACSWGLFLWQFALRAFSLIFVQQLLSAVVITLSGQKQL